MGVFLGPAEMKESALSGHGGSWSEMFNTLTSTEHKVWSVLQQQQYGEVIIGPQNNVTGTLLLGTVKLFYMKERKKSIQPAFFNQEFEVLSSIFEKCVIF